jgi:hypothetical protein
MAVRGLRQRPVQRAAVHLTTADCDVQCMGLRSCSNLLDASFCICKARQLARPAAPTAAAGAGLLLSEFAARPMHGPTVLQGLAPPASRVQQPCMLQQARRLLHAAHCSACAERTHGSGWPGRPPRLQAAQHDLRSMLYLAHVSAIEYGTRCLMKDVGSTSIAALQAHAQD